MKPQAAQTAAAQPSQENHMVDLLTVGEMDSFAAIKEPLSAVQRQVDAASQGAGAGGKAACAAEQPEAGSANAAESRCKSSAGRGAQTWNELQAEGIPGADDHLAEAAANWDSAAGALACWPQRDV